MPSGHGATPSGRRSLPPQWRTGSPGTGRPEGSLIRDDEDAAWGYPLRGAPIILQYGAQTQVGMPNGDPASGCGGCHLPQLFLEIAELVAQPGRQLEVQVGSRLVHLDRELLDEVGKVGRGHLGLSLIHI